MIEIKCDGLPYMIGEARVDRLVVKPIGLAAFLKARDAARQAMAVAKASDFPKFIARERRAIQISAIDAAGKAFAISETAMMEMPIRYAVAADRAMQEVLDDAGTIVIEGDGAGSAVIYALGKPLTASTKGGDAVEISEIEFNARTLRDVEDVLAAGEGLDGALAFIQKCGKPVGKDVTLQALPSWAVEQISLADGVQILNEVMPGFFG